jgi:hypothetical protein
MTNKKNTITPELINDIIANTQVVVDTLFDKTTIVTAKLPNGFVIVESSSCVDPVNYDIKIGYDICIERIKNQVWLLEGYKLQDKVYQSMRNAKLN